MTAKHTPGESWVVDECPDAEGFQTIRRADGTANGDTDQQPIATVYHPDFGAMIAAAPEMREALRGLIEQLEGIGVPDWHGAEGLDLTEARALLARLEE